MQDQEKVQRKGARLGVQLCTNPLQKQVKGLMIKKGSQNSACYDIFHPRLTSITLNPRSYVKIDTLVKLDIPKGYYVQLYTRSGLASKGVTVNGGVIDSDYLGKIFVMLTNHSNSQIVLSPGSAIAQLRLIKLQQTQIFQIQKIQKQTQRGQNGFGSTDNIGGVQIPMIIDRTYAAKRTQIRDNQEDNSLGRKKIKKQ